MRSFINFALIKAIDPLSFYKGIITITKMSIYAECDRSAAASSAGTVSSASYEINY